MKERSFKDMFNLRDTIYIEKPNYSEQQEMIKRDKPRSESNDKNKRKAS